jgi:hypothetical protein
MGKAFAEKILDSMVDENGHCGERGLSSKQFTILSSLLVETEWEYVTSWRGNYGKRDFYQRDYIGNIGKYHVVLNLYAHFNDRYTVKSIDLRPEEEYKAEVEAEERLRKLRDFSNSQWVSESKKRLDLELTLVNETCFPTNYGIMNVYTFNDGNGNCIVWKTGNDLCMYFEEMNDWGYAEVGDKVTMRATIKEHGEYKGTKQTVVTRAQVKSISEA